MTSGKVNPSQYGSELVSQRSIKCRQCLRISRKTTLKDFIALVQEQAGVLEKRPNATYTVIPRTKKPYSIDTPAVELGEGNQILLDLVGEDDNGKAEKSEKTQQLTAFEQENSMIEPSSNLISVDERGVLCVNSLSRCHLCQTQREKCLVCPNNFHHHFCGGCLKHHFAASAIAAMGCPVCVQICPCVSCQRRNS